MTVQESESKRSTAGRERVGIFAPLSAIPGISAEVEAGLQRLTTLNKKPARLVDLAMYIPTLVEYFRPTILASARDGESVLIEAVVERHRPPVVQGQPHIIGIRDRSGRAEVPIFGLRSKRLRKLHPVGSRLWVTGTYERRGGSWQISKAELHIQRPDATKRTYPLNSAVSRTSLDMAIRFSTHRLIELREWHVPAILSKLQLPSFAQALAEVQGLSARAVLAGEARNVLNPNSPAMQRLAFDEIFVSFVANYIRHPRQERPPGQARRCDGRYRNAILAALPFTLTDDQARCVEEICADLASDKRMRRLLLGDVGCGKSIVELLSMAAVAEAGEQSALLVPTETLANQHYRKMLPIAQAAGLSFAILTSSQSPRQRAATLEGLATGAIDLVVGTTSLLMPTVVFARLGLAVVDEQHRFGVDQRETLRHKGPNVDMLLATATPIPRTTAMLEFGDIAVSEIRTKPPGRTPIKTVAVCFDGREAVFEQLVAKLAAKFAAGERAFWVLSRVEDAKARFEALRQRFGDRVGLVYGEMRPLGKDKAMAAFATGEIDILVATTVIEVGIDVPEATIMIIEHPEHFGLAQLHQLRGRVGRGSLPSTCTLLIPSELDPVAQERIRVIKGTDDGLEIAEADLRLRGGGNVLGTEQAGHNPHRFIDQVEHGHLFVVARRAARELFRDDPDLAGPRAKSIKVLLEVFGFDQEVASIRAGD